MSREQATTGRWKLPWEVVSGMTVRPDPSVPRGTILVNPDDFRAWLAECHHAGTCIGGPRR